jgi:hypothetical protein
MPENDVDPKGPKTFEPCHVCGHEPQHVQFMVNKDRSGQELENPEMCHRYVCTHCNEGVYDHDQKGYAGLDWNGKQLKAKREMEKGREKIA